ncbi:MAG: hypothetical protein LUF33_06670 [Clostridiales bacterium]|nr:hypothetical protein [Clostridiales bacterium]
MSINEDKSLIAVRLLTDKAAQLGRLPKKTDFDSKDACFIKQKLGPWPRALETAGLKPHPAVSTKEKSKIKRERISRAKKELNKKNEK